MRPLERFQLDRDVFVVIELAVKGELPRCEPGEEQLDGFFENGLRRFRIHAVKTASTGETPLPMPISRRPPLIWSSMHSSSKSRNG